MYSPNSEQEFQIMLDNNLIKLEYLPLKFNLSLLKLFFYVTHLNCHILALCFY